MDMNRNLRLEDDRILLTLMKDVSSWHSSSVSEFPQQQQLMISSTGNVFL